MLRALVLDDSPTVRRFVTRTLEATGRFVVCGMAADGRGAARAVQRLRPSVVVMDMQMPHVDGLEATRAIMSSAPCPIVLFCGVGEPCAQRRAFAALAAGAIALVPKPGPGVDMQVAAKGLVSNVEVAARATPLERPQHDPKPRRATPARASGGVAPPMRASSLAPIVAIGASTGGPAALRSVLRSLPTDPGAPCLVVQHMMSGFLKTFCAWLDGEVPQRVVVAQAGLKPTSGVVYVAPSEGHLVLQGDTLKIDASPPVGAHRPAINALFRSVARARGAVAVGVLLTGMGRDGAQGLLELREAGALTIAQDAGSSVVDGMPRAARELGAAARVLPLTDVPGAILAGLLSPS